MKATVLCSASTAVESFELEFDSFKVGDGFLKVRNASINDGKKEVEVWIPLGLVKTIVWKDKPEDPVEETKKE